MVRLKSQLIGHKLQDSLKDMGAMLEVDMSGIRHGKRVRPSVLRVAHQTILKDDDRNSIAIKPPIRPESIFSVGAQCLLAVVLVLCGSLLLISTLFVPGFDNQFVMICGGFVISIGMFVSVHNVLRMLNM